MSTFRAENPEKIVFTLVATMTLEDWRKIRDQLINDTRDYAEHPMSILADEMSDMITQAERIYYPGSKESIG